MEKTIAKHNTKEHKKAHYLKGLRNIFAGLYSSAKNVHVTIFDNLSDYISNSFGYAPGRGKFPDEKLLWH